MTPRVLLLLGTLAGAAALAAQEPAQTNSVGMEFVLIAPGRMVVGRFEPPYPKPVDPAAPSADASARPSPARGRGTPLTAAEYARIEQMAKADESPGFPVTIDHPYYIGRYEVTQAQWKAVMGSNPSVFQGARVTGDVDVRGVKVPNDADRHPVDNVTWEDAQAFVKKLNAVERTHVYRLPTEFEWEYAARAGGDGDTPWAEIRLQAWAGYNQYTSTFMAGLKAPNKWGLYDMLGNVWEWVQDYYNEKVFADPIPPRTGRVHVLKGGGFVADVKNAIPATHAGGPGSKFDVGVRIVRDVR